MKCDYCNVWKEKMTETYHSDSDRYSSIYHWETWKLFYFREDCNSSNRSRNILMSDSDSDSAYASNNSSLLNRSWPWILHPYCASNCHVTAFSHVTINVTCHAFTIIKCLLLFQFYYLTAFNLYSCSYLSAVFRQNICFYISVVIRPYTEGRARIFFVSAEI